MTQPSPTIDNQRQCAATTQAGQPCQARARLGGTFCYRHDPEVDPEERRAARAKGGANRSNLARLARRIPSDLHGLLGTVLDATAKLERGELSPSQATAMANLAAAAVKIHEVAVLETRLADLEATSAADTAQPHGHGFNQGGGYGAPGWGTNNGHAAREVA